MARGQRTVFENQRVSGVNQSDDYLAEPLREVAALPFKDRGIGRFAVNVGLLSPVAIDLRLPDRLVVQLSEDAAKAREEALKKKDPKKKVGDA